MSSTSCTVLCVDDDPSIVSSMTRLLKLEGFRVFSTSLELAAIEMAEVGEPEAILLDVSMPSRSGLSILSEFRRHPRFSEVPIIIVSGMDDHHTVQAAKNLGANAFVSKPFEPDLLVLQIQELIHAKRKERSHAAKF